MLNNLPVDLIKFTFSFLNQDELFELRRVCHEFKKHTSLRILYELQIRGKNLYLLEHNPKVFKNLKVLNCSGNQLTEIPHIEGLEQLYCYGNDLTQIPHIEGLKKLCCYNNQLTQIPHIEGLRELDCSDNQLTKIPHIDGCKIIH